MNPCFFFKRQDIRESSQDTGSYGYVVGAFCEMGVISDEILDDDVWGVGLSLDPSFS